MMRDSLGSVQSLLVLGGTSEIALATAVRMARERLRTVVLAARDADRARLAAEGLCEAGVEDVDVIPFDARDVGSHAAAVDAAFDRHGDIDAVLVALGVLGQQGDDQLAGSVEVISTNFLGAASGMVPAVERLVAQGHGTLIVLSSVAAERARKSNFVYGSSKAGMDAFLQGLGDSLVGTGVRVMVVRPGFIHTKMTEGMDPKPLATTPDAVGDAIVRGVARGSETVWVPGPMRYVMSVLRHVPRPLFRKLPL
jgi:decaprenylphospho-beta-D-erythro-pentofuranosid-2-ulose 2-reductase